LALDKLSPKSTESGAIQGERQPFFSGLELQLDYSPRWRPIVFLIVVAQSSQEVNMPSLFHRLWMEEKGQDIAEYAVMLALILVLVVGTIRLVGSNANNVFSSVASSVQ